MVLSERAKKSLRLAGWSEDHHYATDSVEREFAKHGHVLLPAAKAFLQSYGGLQCVRRSPYQSGVASHTNPIGVAGMLTLVELREHEQAVGAKLCPVGEAGFGFLWLLMDEHGAVYAVDEYCVLHEWGNSGEDLIERLA